MPFEITITLHAVNSWPCSSNPSEILFTPLLILSFQTFTYNLYPKSEDWSVMDTFNIVWSSTACCWSCGECQTNALLLAPDRICWLAVGYDGLWFFGGISLPRAVGLEGHSRSCVSLLRGWEKWMRSMLRLLWWWSSSCPYYINPPISHTWSRCGNHLSRTCHISTCALLKQIDLMKTGPGSLNKSLLISCVWMRCSLPSLLAMAS